MSPSPLMVRFEPSDTTADVLPTLCVCMLLCLRYAR